MFDLTVSSSSPQSDPTICWSGSVTNVQSSSFASLSFFLSKLVSVTADVEEDDVAFSISDCSLLYAVCRVALLLRQSLDSLASVSVPKLRSVRIFPVPLVLLVSLPPCACICDAISRFSASGTCSCVTTFTSPSILAAMSAACVEKEFRCGRNSSRSTATSEASPVASPTGAAFGIGTAGTSIFLVCSASSCLAPLPVPSSAGSEELPELGPESSTPCPHVEHVRPRQSRPLRSGHRHLQYYLPHLRRLRECDLHDLLWKCQGLMSSSSGALVFHCNSACIQANGQRKIKFEKKQERGRPIMNLPNSLSLSCYVSVCVSVSGSRTVCPASRSRY